jgi:hypothetical protein
MYKLLHYKRADYSVVVKNRAPPPKAWRWEIYRAGNAKPIKQSSIYFDTKHRWHQFVDDCNTFLNSPENWAEHAARFRLECEGFVRLPAQLSSDAPWERRSNVGHQRR